MPQKWTRPSKMDVAPWIGGGDHRDKNILFESIQVNSIVIPIYKTRGKRIFDFGVHLNPPHLTWNLGFLAQKRLKMATGRKGCSWLKWPQLDWYQLIWYYNTPRKYQESLRQPQTPPRHLPDTLKTPQNMAHFDQSETTGRKGSSY